MRTTSMKIRRSLLLIAVAITATIFLQRCTTKTTQDVTIDTQYATDPKIADVINPNNEVPVPVNFILDTSFNNEKSHSNVNWKSRYFDFSDTWITGRFQEFHFVPDFPVPPNKLGGVHCAKSKGVSLENLNFNPNFPATWFFADGPNTQGPPSYFRFNGNDLSKNYFKAYVLVSTCNTSEPGRDSYIGCGQNYFGTTWTDSNRITVDPLADTAWLYAKPGTWVRQGNGYIVQCDFTFNRTLPATNGSNGGTPITKTIPVYVTYNGSFDFLTNGGPAGTLRCGFSATFKFNRSDFMGKTQTKAYLPFPKASEKANSDIAFNSTATFKTYGTWSGSVADEMIVTANMVFSKAHQ